MDSISNITGGIERMPKAEMPVSKAPAQDKKREASTILRDSVDIGKGKPEEQQAAISREKATSLSKAEGITDMEKSFVSAHVDGWLGSNFANLNLNQNGDSVNVDGWVGSGTAHINERKHGNNSTITGNIHAPGEGYKHVNINSYGQDGYRRISGWIGGDNVFLNETSFGKTRQVMGRVGRRQVDIRYQSLNGSIRLEGFIRDQDTWNQERVWITGNQNPPDPPISYLGILPALMISNQAKGNIAG